MNNNNKNTTPCRYGNNCYNINNGCKFYHSKNLKKNTHYRGNFKIIETNSYLLKPVDDDKKTLVNFNTLTNEKNDHYEGSKKHISISESIKTLNNWMKNKYKMYFIFSKSTNDFIGTIGFIDGDWRNDKIFHQKMMLRIKILKIHQNKGIGREIYTTFCEYWQNQMSDEINTKTYKKQQKKVNLYAMVDRENEISLKFHLKCGFTTFRESYKFSNGRNHTIFKYK